MRLTPVFTVRSSVVPSSFLCSTTSRYKFGVSADHSFGALKSATSVVVASDPSAGIATDFGTKATTFLPSASYIAADTFAVRTFPPCERLATAIVVFADLKSSATACTTRKSRSSAFGTE